VEEMLFLKFKMKKEKNKREKGVELI